MNYYASTSIIYGSIAKLKIDDYFQKIVVIFASRKNRVEISTISNLQLSEKKLDSRLVANN